MEGKFEMLLLFRCEFYEKQIFNVGKALNLETLLSLMEHNGAEWNRMERGGMGQNGIETRFHCLDILWNIFVRCLEIKRNETNYNMFIPILPLFKKTLCLLAERRALVPVFPLFLLH